MSDISVGAVSTRTTATQGTSQAGSTALRAYERAVKALTAAQQKLTQDVAEPASEATLETDRAALQLAQIAVQAAAATLAREQQEKVDDSTSADATTSLPRESRLDVLA